MPGPDPPSRFMIERPVPASPVVSRRSKGTRNKRTSSKKAAAAAALAGLDPETATPDLTATATKNTLPPIPSTEIPSTSSGEGDAKTSSSSSFLSTWHKWQRKIPGLKRVQELYLRVPRRFRMCCFGLWICWKFVVALAFLIVFFGNTTTSEVSTSTSTATAIGVNYPSPPTRILYIMTTLAEFNSGNRATIRGQDRLGEVVIPMLVENVQTILEITTNHVDVFLICAYHLKPEREQFLRDSLPPGVGFQVWDNAAPLGYDKNTDKEIKENTRALARQHRYVIKDKFPYYDMFLAFEDDMRITGPHVSHYLAMSDALENLMSEAPETLDNGVPDEVENYKASKFMGAMTKQQLSRVIPGFFRVEVLLNETIADGKGAQQNVLPVPQDYEVENKDGTTTTRHVDPSICCHVHSNQIIEDSENTKGHPHPTKRHHHLPAKPPAEDLVAWETNIKAFSLRQMPKSSSSSHMSLDWAVLMLGPGKNLDPKEKLSGYWSGRDGAFGEEEAKPTGGDPRLIAQQGGWMLTRRQLERMNHGLCQANFLPPFDEPSYKRDGQESKNVEFWSGSYQVFTGVIGGCNMQRIIDMENFSKHLLYHVANNKQKQLQRERMVQADVLFAQLNAVRKMALKAAAAAIS